MRKRHDESVHFSGHLRVLACYSCPLLWTLAHARLLCVVHFSGHSHIFLWTLYFNDGKLLRQ